MWHADFFLFLHFPWCLDQALCSTHLNLLIFEFFRHRRINGESMLVQTCQIEFNWVDLLISLLTVEYFVMYPFHTSNVLFGHPNESKWFPICALQNFHLRRYELLNFLSALYFRSCCNLSSEKFPRVALIFPQYFRLAILPCLRYTFFDKKVFLAQYWNLTFWRFRYQHYLITFLASIFSSNISRMYVGGKWKTPCALEMIINLCKQQKLSC